MSRPLANLRLFVAVYPPRELSAKLLAALQSHDLPEHRLITPEQVHVTLHFIGDTPTKKLDSTIESVERATAGIRAFDITVQGLITLGPRGLVRLIAAETDRPPELLEIQRRLVTRLARSPRRDASDRFRPHLTLCRLKKPTRGIELENPLDSKSFVVDKVALMKSTLRSDGAQHHEIISCALGEK